MKRDISEKSADKSKATPLMPKATAVWLVDNTALTFAQIADFCDLHALVVQSIADGETVAGISGVDPVRNRQVSQQELERCIADPDARLTLMETALPTPQKRVRGPRYTPLVKRVAKPDAILWCLKSYPDLSDAQIIRLIGTTKSMINAIKNRSHWNMRNLQPRNPADLGLCTYSELQAAVEKAERVKVRVRAEKARIARIEAKRAGVSLEVEPETEQEQETEQKPESELEQEQETEQKPESELEQEQETEQKPESELEQALASNPPQASQQG